MVLWQKSHEFRPDGDFVHWACGIAFNLIRNYRVKKRRDRHCFSDEMIAQIAEVRSKRSDWLDTKLEALGDCMEDIQLNDRQLLSLCYAGTRSIRSVSAELGRTENSVYQHLHRIRTKLLECIERKTHGKTLP
jgi:RNA polymerase sigma-70 factor (ECF subfamily)